MRTTRTIRTMTTIGAFLSALASGGGLGACSSDGGSAPTADAGRGDATSDGGLGDRDEPDAPPADAAAPAYAVVHGFDATKFELAEGLTLRGGRAYVSLAPRGSIVEIGPDGTTTPYASVPAAGSDGYALGVLFGDDGALYVAQTKNDAASTVAPGIYKIPKGADGGTVTAPFATHAEMTFPNGLAFLPNGRLLATDSATGQIFVVDTSSGATTVWNKDPLLSGTPACPGPLPFPIGANGVVVSGGAVFVVNTARGSLVKIALEADGSAGAASAVVEDCKYIGLDGMAVDDDGTFLVAQNGSPGKLLRMTAEGAVTTLIDGAPLDGPASVQIAPSWNGKKTALVTNSAFFSVGVDGGAPRPSLGSFAPLP